MEEIKFDDEAMGASALWRAVVVVAVVVVVVDVVVFVVAGHGAVLNHLPGFAACGVSAGLTAFALFKHSLLRRSRFLFLKSADIFLILRRFLPAFAPPSSKSFICRPR